jgi:hypothetical protein
MVCFSSFLSCFLFLTIFFGIYRFYNLKGRGGFGLPAATSTGPNDARRVVWVNGIFFYTNKYFYIIYRYYLVFKGMKKPGTMKKGPKRVETTCLGHLSTSPACHITTTTAGAAAGPAAEAAEAGKAATRRTGPNDARRVVWAISM